jgi:hypothetical protein
MRAHTITTQPRVGGRGRMKRRIVPAGILALSLTVVLLVVTASTVTASTATASPDLFLWCAPLPTTPTNQFDDGCLEQAGPREVFDFGDRQIGTTSPAQGFALAVKFNDTFNPRISVSGDYTQANSCPPRLSGPLPMGGGCLIIVTFAPTGTGPKEGTLRTGPGGPTVALTGKGVTTPTPPVLPLTLDTNADTQKLRRSGVVTVQARARIGHCIMPSCPDYDDTKLVLRGDIKKTTKHLATNAFSSEFTEIKARLKHLKQLREEPTTPKIQIKFTATDEFGQTATEKTKLELCSRLVPTHESHIRRCVWHPSRK